jgi:hypothetical protein
LESGIASIEFRGSHDATADRTVNARPYRNVRAWMVCRGAFGLKVTQGKELAGQRPRVTRRLRLLVRCRPVGIMPTMPHHQLLAPFAWLATGLCIYFFYGRHHSVLTRVPASAGHMATGGASGKGERSPRWRGGSNLPAATGVLSS